MKDEKNFLDAMEFDIMNADIPESEKKQIDEKFLAFEESKNKFDDNWCNRMWQKFNYQCIV